MHARTLAALVAGTVALLGAAPAHADNHPDGTVCNEAEHSPRAGYVVPSGDTGPAATQPGPHMNVGNGDAPGLANAAEHSPALAICVPDTGGTGGGGPF